jgi:hypothetical protein
MFYCAVVAVFSVAMIYKVAPRHGKAFGIALKMTFNGDNQFTHPSTYVFVIMIVGCILTQMNYFNKALSQFSTNMYDFGAWAELETDLRTVSILCTT